MFRAGKLSWQALLHAPYDASAWWRVEQDSRMASVAARLGDHTGNSAAARLWARLVDVARTLGGLLEMEKPEMGKPEMGKPNAASEETAARPWIRVHSLGNGDGMAEVECARGVLVHRVQLAEQNIVAYDVCAPTDWNLHSEGSLATLIGLPATDVARLRAHATWLVQMLDPCVAFDIEVVHA
jgi:Ni,Fe-hydrogenase I large subunit